MTMIRKIQLGMNLARAKNKRGKNLSKQTALLLARNFVSLCTDQYLGKRQFDGYRTNYRE